MVTTVGIAGMGLMGGSLARRLARTGATVLGWNHNTHPYAAAEEEGIICMPSLDSLARSSPGVLILCMPLRAIPEALSVLRGGLDREATTLTDIGSVKGAVRRQIDVEGLGECYVGAHPMAGNEYSGFGASDPALYDDALWALTVGAHTQYRRFLDVARLITEQVGDRLITLDDETHDRAAALISHMPHAVSTAMINQLTADSQRDIAVALAAGSWRDMTRVALTDPERTRAMIEEDSGNVEGLLREISARLLAFADALHRGDQELISQFFLQGQPYRDFKADTGRHGHISERLLQLDPARWQQTLLESARRGEQVVGFRSSSQVAVQRRSDF